MGFGNLNWRTWRMNPLVTVIVPHHLDENHEYLQLCLDSIIASKGVDFELICVADTLSYPRYRHTPSTGKWNLTIVHRPDLNTGSAKFNWAVKNSDQNSQYVWVISDDVMIAGNAMKKMVEGLGDKLAICNPMSNSDNWGHFLATNLPIPVKVDIKDFWDTNLLNLIAYKNCPPNPILIPAQNFVSFYCTMIPRHLINLVGDLDERMEYRHNDQDYCYRAMKLGAQCMINLAAFALHFGDKTIPKCTTREQLEECSKVFLDKYKQ